MEHEAGAKHKISDWFLGKRGRKNNTRRGVLESSGRRRAPLWVYLAQTACGGAAIKSVIWGVPAVLLSALVFFVTFQNDHPIKLLRAGRWVPRTLWDHTVATF